MTTQSDTNADQPDTNASDASDTAAPSWQSPANVRKLRFVVMALGVILVLGLLIVLGRIIHLATRSSPGIATGQTVSSIAPEIALPLPQGAAIGTMTLSGNLLAVHYTTGTKPAIVIVDLISGTVVSRVNPTPQVPGN